MNIIDEQHSYINEIVSTQKYDSTKRYNKSQFAFIHVYNGKYLAYNTLFCSLYELNEHEYNVLINPIDGDEEILKKLVEMWIKQLIFSHFLRVCVIFVKFEKSIENKIYYIYNNLCKILNFYYLK